MAKKRTSKAGPAPAEPPRPNPTLERMALASEAAATPAHGEAGDFKPTSDLRATSDLLWRALAEFRRRLIVGGEWSVLEWRELLQTVRDHADVAGLKPEFAGVGSIMATAGEAVAADAQTFDSAMLAEPWRWVVLIAEGPGGWIQEHDLAGAFFEHAGHAIRWAESWMLARERQLVGLAMEATATGEAGSGKPIADDLRTARWFADATGPDGLYAELLKAARRAGKLPSSKQPHTHWLYSASEVARNWPEYRGRIMDKLADEAETNGNGR